MVATVIMLAATLAMGQQEPLTAAQRTSVLGGLSPEAKTWCRTEHARVGKAINELVGFPLGQGVDAYRFAEAQTNANLVLPHEVLGFTEFQPFVTQDTLCGLYLKQAVPRDEKGQFSSELFAAAREASRTNLAERLGLRPDNLNLSTNGIQHAWRISYEQWHETLVLRLCDEELAQDLMVKADEKRKADEAARLLEQRTKVEE